MAIDPAVIAQTSLVHDHRKKLAAKYGPDWYTVVTSSESQMRLRRERFATIDNLPPEWKRLVWEQGWERVELWRKHGWTLRDIQRELDNKLAADIQLDL